MKVKSLSHVRLIATQGLQPTSLLRPRDFPDKSTGVGSHCLLLITTIATTIMFCKDKTHAAWTFHTVSNCPQISLLSPPLHHHYQAAMFLLLLNLEEEKPQSLGHLAGIPDSIPPQDAMASREARCQRKSHPSQGCKPLRRVQSQQGSESCPSLNVTST